MGKGFVSGGAPRPSEVGGNRDRRERLAVEGPGPAARLILACGLGSLAASGMAGCGVSGGGGGGGPVGEDPGQPVQEGDNADHGGGPFGDDGGTTAAPVNDGAVVAELETASSTVDSIVLRGTFPVPPGSFPRNDGRSPFVIEDYDGAQLETQTELVTRYPDAADGADVVEVLARVRFDPAVAPGSQVVYRVLQVPHDPPVGPGAPGVEDLADHTKDVPASIRGLLADPDGITITATDVFGNRYACRPLDGTGEMRLERQGIAATQLRVYQTMLPEPAVGGPSGTLPHLFGVHAYLTTLQGEELVGLDLRFHNGHSGLSNSTTDDDPLDTVYFERIEIELPDGFRVQQSFADPYLGSDYLNGAKRVRPVVAPMGDGTMHVMRWQGQFHRRLMISTDANTGLARNYLDGNGQAFCRRGFAPGGHKLWSWWNPGTARYFPQRFLMPSLDHLGLASVRGSMASDYFWLNGHLQNGTSDGIYPIASGVLGWGHPYGTAYGGMTSGAEIYLFDGIETAASASVLGFRAYQATHRMHTDRMPTAFYDADGSPSALEDWLVVVDGGDGDYVPFNFYGRPDLPFGADAFGVHAAPSFQAEHVQASSLQPGYEEEHLFYDPHDLQHYVRYTRSAKVLAWLGNDPLAKDDLLMQAENGALSYHPYANSPFGGAQGTGMRASIDAVAANPGQGFGMGRGEGWIIDAMAAAYSVADPTWRSAKRGWFDALANLVSDGQASCNGFIQSVVRPKFFNGKYRARQAIEQSIIENALRGVRESVYRDTEPGFAAMLGDVLVDLHFSAISPMAWFHGEPAPWSHSANGPQDGDLPVWCNVAQMPSDGVTSVYENFQNWSSYAYAYDLTGSDEFLERATLQTGGASLLTQMLGSGTGNLGNQAALIALAQRLNGDL